MKFERKIFLAAAGLSFALCALTAASIFVAERERMIDAFRDRYEALTATIASTLTQLDQASGDAMTMALKVAAARISHGRLPSDAELKRLRDELGVTSVDVIRRDGVFVRSSSFPEYGSLNLYSFCEGYRALFASGNTLVRVPIMPSPLFKRAVKFSLLSLPGAAFALNVGYELDFIGRTLREALAADPNLAAVGLFTPSGRRLGEYDGRAARAGGDALELTRRVDSSVKTCCDCRRRGFVDGDESDYHYVLRARISTEALFSSIRRLRWTVAALLGVALMLSLGLARLVARALNRRIRQVDERARVIVAAPRPGERIGLVGHDEIAGLAGRFDAVLDALEGAQGELIAAEKNQAFAVLASQVSHDIRSPLTALQLLLGQVKAWPEEQRVLAAAAIARITDIANVLLEKSRASRVNSPGEVEPIPALVESLISEKRVELGPASPVRIEADLEGAYGLFARVDAAGFKRALSNLVNNAAEACARGGLVRVTLTRRARELLLTIEDDGCGMPEHVRARIGQPHLSFGKPGGCGLGLSSSVETIRAAGGALEVAARPPQGTRVSVTLPLAPPPAWFVARLDLAGIDVVFSVDDDPAIHGVWRQKLKAAGFRGRHEAITDAGELAVEPRALYLVDVELGAADGIDVVERLGLATRAILVTSRHEEPRVRAACRRLRVGLIPKNTVCAVPLRAGPFACGGAEFGGPA